MKSVILSFSVILLFSFTACSKNDCKEKEISDCVVTYELNPVCGCNDKTYANPSEASCSGIEDYTMGACQ